VLLKKYLPSFHFLNHFVDFLRNAFDHLNIPFPVFKDAEGGRGQIPFKQKRIITIFIFSGFQRKSVLTAYGWIFLVGSQGFLGIFLRKNKRHRLQPLKEDRVVLRKKSSVHGLDVWEAQKGNV